MVFYRTPLSVSFQSFVLKAPKVVFWYFLQMLSALITYIKDSVKNDQSSSGSGLSDVSKYAKYAYI